MAVLGYYIQVSKPAKNKRVPPWKGGEFRAARPNSGQRAGPEDYGQPGHPAEHGLLGHQTSFSRSLLRLCVDPCVPPLQRHAAIQHRPEVEKPKCLIKVTDFDDACFYRNTNFLLRSLGVFFPLVYYPYNLSPCLKSFWRNTILAKNTAKADFEQKRLLIPTTY